MAWLVTSCLVNSFSSLSAAINHKRSLKSPPIVIMSSFYKYLDEGWTHTHSTWGLSLSPRFLRWLAFTLMYSNHQCHLLHHHSKSIIFPSVNQSKGTVQNRMFALNFLLTCSPHFSRDFEKAPPSLLSLAPCSHCCCCNILSHKNEEQMLESCLRKKDAFIFLIREFSCLNKRKTCGQLCVCSQPV